MRIWGMEKAAMEQEMTRQAEMSNATEDPATCAALAFRALCDNSRTLDLINRYDSRYQREYLRAHRRFLEVHDRRTPPVTHPPQSGPQQDEGTFPSGTADVTTQPTTQPAPAEPVHENPSADEKIVLSKRTREVVANKAAQASVRCAADTKAAADTAPRAANPDDAEKSMNTKVASIRFHPFPSEPKNEGV
jgi:hypothetical protein